MGRLRDLFKNIIGHVLRTEKLSKDFQLFAWIPLIFLVILSSSQFVVAVRSDSHEYANSVNSESDVLLLNETDIKDFRSFEEPGQNLNDHHHYTHQWALHIVGGKENADRIAEKHGFVNTGEIFPSYYHFVHQRIVKRSVKPSHEYHTRLSAEPEVRWLQQQKVKRRTKRDFMSFSAASQTSSKNSGGRLRSARKSRAVAFNDPRWPGMWYLNRGAGLDMNVMEAWNEGITGKGIVVTILDDGLEKDHPDIVRNYDPMASFDVNSLDMDPMPTYDLTDSNRHGTRCAGEVAAEANNSICAVGIAYEAGVGGVRMLDGDVTDAVEARSLSHNPQHIDIYSASWGPDDDGKTVDGPGELATRAFLEGVTKGRSGKGSIFVWASGNGGRDHDNCNCDGYTNSIWTLSISSATENGLVPWYSEACSSTLATTYSSGGTGEKQIVTIDLHHSCTSSHTGTSASAPLAAGICALALQANTNLTWRDMQHIVVRTARPQNLIAPDWATNGVGRNVSHSFGYGLMDAGAMVKLARKWKTVPEQNKCEIRAPYSEKNIPAKSKVTLDLKVTNCTGVNFLEHVQAKVTLTSGRRGDLQIFLVSPAGTRSVLLAHRRHDLNRSGFTDWPFMTVHSWGEYPIGKWTLEIHNEGRYAGRTVLKRWSLIAYGTEEDANSSSVAKKDFSASQPKQNIPVPNSKPNFPPPKSNVTSAYNSNSNDEKVGPSDNLNGNGNTKAETVASNSGEVGGTSIVRKPYRQRQFKGKFLSKKQKLATSAVAPQQSPTSRAPLLPNGHLDSDDEEFRQFLHTKFGLTQNQSFSTVNGTISIVAASKNNTFSTNKESESTSAAISGDSRPPLSPSPSPSSSLGGIEILPPPPPHKNFPPPNYNTTSGKTSSSSLVEGPPVTSWETTTVATVNHTHTSQGKLQTWALVAHGITADPNGPDGGSGIGGGDMRGGPAADTAVAGSDPSAAVEFDGSDNTIVMPSHVHSPPLASNAEVADSSVSIATSVASSPSSSNCAKVSANGQCLECNGSLSLLHGQCFSSCPDNYFRRSRSLATAYVSMGSERTTTSYTNWVCLPCHYTCRTCSGSNDYECLSCHSDSSLHRVRESDQGAHCYPVVLLDQVDTYAFWYKSLVVTVLVNVIIVLTLGSYICCQNRGNGRLGVSLDPNSGNWYKQRQAYHRIARDDEIDKDNEHLDEDDLSVGIDFDSDELNEYSNSNRPRVMYSGPGDRDTRNQTGVNFLHSDKSIPHEGVAESSFPNGQTRNTHSKQVPLVNVLPLQLKEISNTENNEGLSKK